MRSNHLFKFLWLMLALLSACQLDNQVQTIQVNPESVEQAAATDSTGLETVKSADWLSVDTQLKDSWQVNASDQIPGLLNRAVQIRSVQNEGKAPKIVAIFSKESSAYDTAMGSMLTLFQGRGLAADILVLNGENDDGVIRTAYAHAQSLGPDLILSFGSKATAWIHENDTGGTIPVVSVTSKDPVLMGQIPNYERGSGTHIAYTSLNIPVELQLAKLKEFRPELQKIGILYAENNSSAVVTQVEPLVAAAEADGIEIIHFTVQDQANAKAELDEMMPNLISKMQDGDKGNNRSLLWITGSTSVFNEIATINQHAAGVPVLSVVTDVTTAGEDSAMMSIGVSFESNALMAAIYALRILEGEAAGDLPVGVVSPPDIAINFAKAAQSGVQIPFAFFESANFIYDAQGAQVRAYGQ